MMQSNESSRDKVPDRHRSTDRQTDDTDDGLNVAGCGWYEVEFLDALLRIAAQGDVPSSIEQLFVHAQVRDGGDGE